MYELNSFPEFDRVDHLAEVDSSSAVSTPAEISAKTRVVIADIAKAKESFEPEEVIDLNSLSTNEAFAIEAMLAQMTGAEIISHLPNPVQLSTISDAARYLLSQLVYHGYFEQLKTHLPLEFDLETLQESGSKFLTYLIQNNYVSEIIKRLPQKIDPEKLTNHAGFMLEALLGAGLIYLIKSRLIIDANTDAKTYGSGAFLAKILDYGYESEFLERLPQRIDCNTLSVGTAIWIRKLIHKGNLTDIVQRLPDSIQLNTLSGGAGFVLCELLKHNNLESITSRFSGEINFTTMSYGVESFLSLLMNRVDIELFTTWLPKSIDINTISDQGGILLWGMIKAGYGAAVLQLIDNIQDIKKMNEGVEAALSLLVQKGFARTEVLEIIHTSLAQSRQAHEVTEYQLIEKIGPYLFEQFGNITIQPESAVHLSGNWIRMRLYKIHETDKESYVYINSESELPKVLFRSDAQAEENRQSFETAQTVLPTYVVGAAYFELNGGKDIIQQRRKGFREVYAGPTLLSLSLAKFPEDIKQDILAQQRYIVLSLALNGIDHGHLHDGNFNVRFLLKKDGSQPQICFDINYAIQYAQKEAMTITPIVTVRDWDLAKTV